MVGCWSASPAWCLLGVGIGMVIYGVKQKFMKHLKTGEMSRKTASWRAAWARPVTPPRAPPSASPACSWSLAAVNYDPEKARGLDAALRTLRDQAYGPILLILIALGIAAFGVYCFLQARYRKV